MSVITMSPLRWTEIDWQLVLKGQRNPAVLVDMWIQNDYQQPGVIDSPM